MDNPYRDIDFMLKVMNHVLDVNVKLLQGTEAVVKTIADARRDNADAKVLKKYLNADKDNKLIPYFYQNKNRDRIEEEIKQYNKTKPPKEQIKYMVSPVNKNISMIIIPDKFEKEASRLMNDIRANIIEGGLVTKDMLWTRSNGEVLKMNGLSTEEVVRLAEKAERAGVCVSLEDMGNDKYNVMFNEKDAGKMAELSSSMIYDLHGECKDIYKKQIDYEINNELRIRDKIMDTKAKPFYIVDADGKTAQVRGTTFIYNAPGQEQLILSRNKHQEEIKMIMGEMRHPVDLTRDEFDRYQRGNLEERKAVMLQADRDHGRPQLTKEEAHKMKDHEEKRSLVERKLLAGHPLEDYIQNAVTNEEIQMSEYYALNEKNDNFEPDKEIMEQMQERQQKLEVEIETKAPDHNDLVIDKDIENGFDREEQEYNWNEAERDYWAVEDQNGDYTADIYQDMNDNGVPDWKESSNDRDWDLEIDDR